MPRPTPQCGTRGRYRKGCRCDACRKANADYQRKGKPPKVRTVGPLTSYTRGCRCQACRDLATAYYRDYYHKNRSTALAKAPPKHGTLSGYNNYGCRCEECKEAKREWHRKDYRKRMGEQ
jgi:hypothetical protein